jgi:ABC-type phosphate/phosphonate transport system permease subunit
MLSPPQTLQPLFFSNLIMTQHPLIISMLRRHLEDNNRAASVGGSCGGGGAGAPSGLARQADTHTHIHTHTGGGSNLAPNHMYPDT